MQRLFEDDLQTIIEKAAEGRTTRWLNFAFGLVGSFIICYLLIRRFATEIAGLVGLSWFQKKPAVIAASGLLSLALASILSRLDGTVWGTYYVIVGYLLSIGLLLGAALHRFGMI
jgi:hypothetical protein